MNRIAKIKCRWITLLMGGFLLSSLANIAEAQGNSERSPYSRYGFGTLSSSASSASKAMGGIGIGLRDPNVVNTLNPASYTSVDSLTFIMDLAISGQASWLSGNGMTDRRLQGNLDYISILFPISHSMAMSAGITPLAQTGYRFGSLVQTTGEGDGANLLRTYSGSGSFNNLYLGLASKIGSQFSLGANLSYLFGRTTHQTQANNANENALSFSTLEALQLKGLKLEVGLQYELELDTQKTRSLVIGLTAGQSLAMKSEHIKARFNSRNGSTGVATAYADTIRSTSNYSLPLTIGTGVSYRVANKFVVGFDGQYSLWSKAKFDEITNQGIGSFSDRYRLALGGEWIPNDRGRNVFSRTRYRLGLYGANSYVKVPTSSGDKGYYELGASIGMGIPLVDRRSFLNLSVDYKTLRPTLSSLVSEQYLGFTLGITFNEGWFRKARVN